MLELLPLAALRLILYCSVVTTISLEMPLMTIMMITGHNRRKWIVGNLLQLHAHVPSH